MNMPIADGVVSVVALVVGLPVLGISSVVVTALLRGWWFKARELKLQEKRLQMEHRMHEDEMNAKLLRMDDFGLSPAQIASLSEEVRQLREEVARLKQEMQQKTR